MKLADWLSSKQITQQSFAETIEVSPAAVSGYVADNHIPGRDTMARIVEATGGAVQPQDFYA